MNKLLFYGAGFFDAVKLVEAINRHQPTWEILGFLDDGPELKGRSLHGVPILGGRELLPEFADRPDVAVFNNVNGSRAGAMHVAELLKAHGCRVPSLVHPSVDLGYVEMGAGCFVPAGCVLGADVKMGDFVTLRYGAILSHEVEVQDFVLIGPGATVGSRARLLRGALIGVGAAILPGVTIGEGCTVGAGAVVARPVAAGKTVAGVPAKELLSEVAHAPSSWDANPNSN